MPAPKGHKKWGGRQKGVPNKSTQKVLDLVREKSGTTPIEVLAEALLDPSKREWAAEKLMPYCYPKLTSVEVSEDKDQPIGEGVVDKTLEKLKELHALSAKERKRG